MTSLQELNVHFSFYSYLGGNVATLRDYERCLLIKPHEIDASSMPHLRRWHNHITQLMRIYGKFDFQGKPLGDGCAADVASSTEKVSTKHAKATLATAVVASAVPASVTLSAGKHTHFCVLDFEKTCERDERLDPQEIIEFPSVLLAVGAVQPVAEFQSYVRPQTNPVLTDFCTELTGIEQGQVDQAPQLQEVLEQHHSWLRSHAPREEECIFVTCGDMDLKVSLPEDPNVPAEVPACYRKWINLKKEFGAFYTRWYPKKGKQPRNMNEMLEKLELPLEGHHHSGIDDCRNIGKVVQQMMSEGWSPLTLK